MAIIKTFKKGDKIPNGAKFLSHKKEFVRMVGWISNLQPYYEDVLYFEVQEDDETEKKVIAMAEGIADIDTLQSENQYGMQVNKCPFCGNDSLGKDKFHISDIEHEQDCIYRIAKQFTDTINH